MEVTKNYALVAIEKPLLNVQKNHTTMERYHSSIGKSVFYRIKMDSDEKIFWYLPHWLIVKLKQTDVNLI